MEVGIRSIGYAVPEKILTNLDFERMVDTTDEWITTRTGIKQRHILSPDERITEFVITAAKLACYNGDQATEKMEFIVSSTIAADRICPPQSFEVARALKTESALCFDINAACSGFIYGLGIAESLLKTRKIGNGIVCAAEQLSRVVDYNDRTTCVLFGDAASAVVLTKDHPEHLILHTELGSEPSMSHELIIGGVSDLLDNRRSEYYLRQNGKTILNLPLTKLKNCLKQFP